MLADDAALESVMGGDEGILAGLAKGALHISMSTIAVATAERLAGEHAGADSASSAPPVFGRPEAAAAGKLFIVAAGAADDVAGAGGVFSAVGQRVFSVGTQPAAAALVKLCGNFMILSAIESMAEAMTLAEKGGVPKAQLLEVLTGSLFDAPVFHNYGKALAAAKFTPAGFAAPLGLKDMRLAGQAAEKLRVPMPLLGVLRDHLVQTIAVEGETIGLVRNRADHRQERRYLSGRRAARNGHPRRIAPRGRALHPGASCHEIDELPDAGQHCTQFAASGSPGRCAGPRQTTNGTVPRRFAVIFEMRDSIGAPSVRPASIRSALAVATRLGAGP